MMYYVAVRDRGVLFVACAHTFLWSFCRTLCMYTCQEFCAIEAGRAV